MLCRVTRVRRFGVVAAVFVLVAAGGVGWWRQREAEDRAVCRALQGLDGRTYQAAVMDGIHRAGRADGGYMGEITRDVEGDRGVIGIDSGEYDYLQSGCADLGIDVEHIDS